MNPRERRSLLAAIGLVASLVVLLWFQGGVVPAAIIGSALVGALLFWYRTSLQSPTDPLRLLPPYILTGAMLMIHIGEEFLAGFAPAVAELSGAAWSETDFVIGIVFLGPIVWISGMVAVARQHPLGGFLSWFLFLGMTVGETAHAIFPLLEPGPYRYFPGLWTSLLPAVPAIWGIHTVWTDYRRRIDPITAEPVAAT